jgi:hypothetical protein
MLAYNTKYHSTIASTPFELLFCVRPRLPSLPAPDIQRVHYGEALKKLLDYKNAATMAISILHQDCNYLQDPYTFTKNYTEYCCDKCYSAFLKRKFDKKQQVCIDPNNLINSSPKFNQ